MPVSTNFYFNLHSCWFGSCSIEWCNTPKESQPSGAFLCLVFPGELFLGSNIDFGALDVDVDGAGDIDVPPEGLTDTESVMGLIIWPNELEKFNSTVIYWLSPNNILIFKNESTMTKLGPLQKWKQKLPCLMVKILSILRPPAVYYTPIRLPINAPSHKQ